MTYSRGETGDRKVKRYVLDMPPILRKIYAYPGITTRELCEAVSIDYERNGSKRCIYWFHNIARYVQRIKIDDRGTYEWKPRLKLTGSQAAQRWIKENKEVYDRALRR